MDKMLLKEFSWISEIILSSGQVVFCAAQWVMETSHQSSYVEPDASIRDILKFPEPCETVVGMVTWSPG